jgi:Tol biopolymer transport system component
MKRIFFLLFAICSSLLTFAQQGIGVFDGSQDIGSPKIKGSANYNAADQSYTLSGAGYNIWFGRDEFHYLFKKIKGDFILTAHFKFEGNGTDQHRKVGWMVRASSDDNAAHVSATVHGDGLTALQWRAMKGAFMRDPQDEIFSVKKHVSIIQLERHGTTFIMRVAHTGEPLQVVGEHMMNDFPGEVLSGIFITSHSTDVKEQAKVWNVRIDQPVSDDYNPNASGYLGSRLETINVFTGERKIIYESPDRIEAPNWMPDGKMLLFNANGSLYTIPLTGGSTQKLNTDFADRNNNDHGISFDKKMLAISHHRQGLPGGGSTVYVLPLQGGTPKQITEATPSYFHGWSADGKHVVVVGQRSTKTYDIYKVPVNGGKEIKLTSTPEGAHVDGPEYSPDGKWIYYNGSTTGTMQLWRMKPNGTNHEQITFDEYNNWFPHISPDGKWIVFISFPPTINFNDHPAYKRVMLRLMPVSGGAPRVIAYLYGGQGTINVPSWSPDSKYVAFVSNSQKEQ